MIRVRARTQRSQGLDRLHRDVLAAMTEALDAADPARIIRKHLRLHGDILRIDKLQFPLKDYRRIIVIGGGKASGHMGEEVGKLLGNWITRGLIIIPDYLLPRPKSRRIGYQTATHPIPSRKGMEAVHAMLRLVEIVSRDDLVIVLISGGGSALMPLPVEGMGLSDEARVTSLLLKSGASIEEINTVRKHLSQIKGGRLAERLYPATVLTLIISDVVGDRIDAIASGPTAPDPTTYRDAEQVLKKYDLWSQIPKNARRVIAGGLSGSIPDTPKRKSRGGRNQEVALAAAVKISGSEGLVVGSFATDGIEGQTDAAGAVVDGSTITRGLELGMDAEEYLRNNDSYRYFSKLKDLVITGPTGTNVNDITILVADHR